MLEPGVCTRGKLFRVRDAVDMHPRFSQRATNSLPHYSPKRDVHIEFVGTVRDEADDVSEG